MACFDGAERLAQFGDMRQGIADVQRAGADARQDRILRQARQIGVLAIGLDTVAGADIGGHPAFGVIARIALHRGIDAKTGIQREQGDDRQRHMRNALALGVGHVKEFFGGDADKDGSEHGLGQQEARIGAQRHKIEAECERRDCQQWHQDGDFAYAHQAKPGADHEQGAAHPGDALGEELRHVDQQRQAARQVIRVGGKVLVGGAGEIGQPVHKAGGIGDGAIHQRQQDKRQQRGADNGGGDLPGIFAGPAIPGEPDNQQDRDAEGKQAIGLILGGDGGGGKQDRPAKARHIAGGNAAHPGEQREHAPEQIRHIQIADLAVIGERHAQRTGAGGKQARTWPGNLPRHLSGAGDDAQRHHQID